MSIQGNCLNKKQIRSISHSPLVRFNNRIENNKRKYDSETEALDEEESESLNAPKIQIKCFKRKLRESIKKDHRSELYKVINTTVSTMFLITHHLYQFLNLHILRICQSFEQNNYKFYDEDQTIIHKFCQNSLRQLADLLFPLSKDTSNVKKSAENRIKREMEEKIDGTNVDEETKGTMKQITKERKDKEHEKLDVIAESLKLTKDMYFEKIAEELKKQIIPFRDGINEIIRQSLPKFTSEFSNMWNANRFKTFVRYLKLVFAHKISNETINLYLDKCLTVTWANMLFVYIHLMSHFDLA
jgi:hypothetical protein